MVIGLAAKARERPKAAAWPAGEPSTVDGRAGSSTPAAAMSAAPGGMAEEEGINVAMLERMKQVFEVGAAAAGAGQGPGGAWGPAQTGWPAASGSEGRRRAARRTCTAAAARPAALGLRAAPAPTRGGPLPAAAQHADADGSGELDIEEFCDKLGPFLGAGLTRTQVAQLFLKIDADAGGTVDWCGSRLAARCSGAQ